MRGIVVHSSAMIPALVGLAGDHSFGFVLAALVLCIVAGWLVAKLMRGVAQARPGPRRRWLAGTALVAGLGVWTTHFIAMLGWRPDRDAGFDGRMTMLSVVLGVLLVGAPLALSALCKSRRLRVLTGAAAGLGIGAMHHAGMAAVQFCVVTHSSLIGSLSTAIGVGCMAMACGLSPRTRASFAVCALFTTAVAGTHFMALAGTRLDCVAGAGNGPHDNITLSVFVGIGSGVVFLGAFLTILMAKRFEAQEQAHSAVLRTALNNMSNGLLFLDANGRARLYNRRYLEVFGFQPDTDLTGLTVNEIVARVADGNGWSAARREQASARLDKWRSLARFTQIDYPMDNGRIMQLEIRPLDEGGTVITFDDVTKEREAQRHVAQLAFSDPLTKLANRRALSARLERDVSAKRRFHLLLIDLDRFKSVNDTHGHAVGDKLLIQVAERLTEIAGKIGFVARQGGDEMAVLVYGDKPQGLAVAGAVIAAISSPFRIDELTVEIGCSIGIGCAEDSSDAADLMQFADVALYESKRQGRGLVSCYTHGMLDAITERGQLEADMRHAIERGEMHLVYQPVLALRDDRLIGYEALIRWDHPMLGALSPARFIPLAEETGQIVAIGAWVLEEACRQAADLPDEIYVAVNVSPVQFQSPLLLTHLTQALAQSGLPARRLEIELTETAIVRDGVGIAQTLNAIRRLGVTVAMDDFGTGYSSLAHLRDFPLDRIKVDRSFVATAETDPHSLAVLEGITHIARRLGVAILAEGVETEAQLQLMRDIGCDAVQGYLVGKPARLAQDQPPPAALSA